MAKRDVPSDSASTVVAIGVSQKIKDFLVGKGLPVKGRGQCKVLTLSGAMTIRAYRKDYWDGENPNRVWVAGDPTLPPPPPQAGLVAGPSGNQPPTTYREHKEAKKRKAEASGHQGNSAKPKAEKGHKEAKAAPRASQSTSERGAHRG